MIFVSDFLLTRKLEFIYDQMEMEVSYTYPKKRKGWKWKWRLNLQKWSNGKEGEEGNKPKKVEKLLQMGIDDNTSNVQSFG